MDRQLGIAGSKAFILSVGWLLVAAGVGLAVLRFTLGDSHYETIPERALSSLPFGAVVAAPGVMAILALRDRAVLLLPAALILVPFSFLSFALVTLPLLIPAVMLAVSYGRRSRTEHLHWLRAIATTVVVVALLVVAALALFVHEDPRSYQTSSSSGTVSDVVTPLEALISLAITCTSVGAGWFLSKPRVRRQAWEEKGRQ